MDKIKDDLWALCFSNCSFNITHMDCRGHMIVSSLELGIRSYSWLKQNYRKFPTCRLKCMQISYSCYAL